MTDPKWFDEQPSKDLKARIEHAGDREIDRRARIANANERRGLLSFLSFETLSAVPVAGIAAAIGFWLVNEPEKSSSPQAREDHDELLDATIEVSDVDLVAEIEFMEDLEILEALTTEEIS